MASTKVYITSGLVPKDTTADDGSTKVYITSGLVPDDVSGGGPTTQDVAGNLPEMSGSLVMKKAYHRAVSGSI